MFNPFLKGQVSFKCGGGFIFIFSFSKNLCIIFNLQMRLGPRARLCFFALLWSLDTLKPGHVAWLADGAGEPIPTSWCDTPQEQPPAGGATTQPETPSGALSSAPAGARQIWRDLTENNCSSHCETPLKSILDPSLQGTNTTWWPWKKMRCPRLSKTHSPSFFQIWISVAPQETSSNKRGEQKPRKGSRSTPGTTGPSLI